VLFEALTGTVPYPRRTAAAAISAHLRDDPPRVSERRPGLPAALDEVIASALAKAPEDRPASAASLLRNAELALGRRPREPPPTLSSEHPPVGRERRSAMSADDELLGLLHDGARAGVVLEHVSGSSGAMRPTQSRLPPPEARRPASPSTPPAPTRPTAQNPPPRRVIVEPDDEEAIVRLRRRDPTASPAPSASPGTPAPPAPPSAPDPRSGARMAYVVAALAGLAAGAAALVKWWPFFTLEVTLATARDTVDCSVFAPPGARPGDRILIQLFAHVPVQAADARALAEEFDGASARRAVRGLETSVARGTSLTFQLTMPGARVEEPVQSLVWQGRTSAVQFSAVVEDGRDHALVGSVAVTQASVPIGHIKFTLEILSPEASRGGASGPVGHEASRYRSAFLSYARQDDRHVLRGAQLLRSLDIDCFQDVRDIEPGEVWERRVYAEIEQRDLFLLFWSRAARESEWVRREAVHAVRCRRAVSADRPEIKPIILERPPTTPWPELAHLHFDDPLMYFVDDS
jgi:hypothetical protein